MDNGLYLIDICFGAKENWAPLMDAGGHDVQNRPFMCDGPPACTLHKECHGVALHGNTHSSHENA